MSSLQENNSTVPLDVVNKRKTAFSRSDSFDKFHYTAFYTLQLAGALLSQKSLLRIIDELQYKSRVLTGKYMVFTLWPTFKKIWALILFWIDAIVRYTGINVLFEKKVASKVSVGEPEKTYILRASVPNASNMISSSSASSDSRRQSLPSEIKTTCTIEEKRIRMLAEFDALHPHLRGSPLTRTWKSSDTESEMGSNNSISPRHNIGMVVIVYGSATLVYVQLMFLAAFLQTVATPPGLIFLVLSLGYIAYIVFKMGFVKTKSKEEISASKAARIAPTSSEDVVGDLPDKRSNSRLSRSFTRRFLYFHNKTLSKIKLL